MKTSEFIQAVKTKNESHVPTYKPMRAINTEGGMWSPTIELTTADLPCLKDYKVGDKVKFEIEAEITSQSTGERSTLKIQKVGEDDDDSSEETGSNSY